MYGSVPIEQIECPAVDKTEPPFGVTRYLDDSHASDCKRNCCRHQLHL